MSGNFFLPQTMLAFFILILVYYCLYFLLYVRRDPLSCQSALSGAGSPLLASLKILWSMAPFSYLSYSPFPLIHAYPVLNNQKMILKLFFSLYNRFSFQSLYLLLFHLLISKMFLCGCYFQSHVLFKQRNLLPVASALVYRLLTPNQ